MCNHEFIIEPPLPNGGPAEQTLRCKLCNNVVFTVMPHECQWEKAEFLQINKDGTKTPLKEEGFNNWVCKPSHQFIYDIPENIDPNKTGEKCTDGHEDFEG